MIMDIEIERKQQKPIREDKKNRQNIKDKEFENKTKHV